MRPCFNEVRARTEIIGRSNAVPDARFKLADNRLRRGALGLESAQISRRLELIKGELNKKRAKRVRNSIMLAWWEAMTE